MRLPSCLRQHCLGSMLPWNTQSAQQTNVNRIPYTQYSHQKRLATVTNKAWAKIKIWIRRKRDRQRQKDRETDTERDWDKDRDKEIENHRETVRQRSDYESASTIKVLVNQSQFVRTAVSSNITTGCCGYNLRTEAARCCCKVNDCNCKVSFFIRQLQQPKQ